MCIPIGTTRHLDKGALELQDFLQLLSGPSLPFTPLFVYTIYKNITYFDKGGAKSLKHLSSCANKVRLPEIL